MYNATTTNAVLLYALYKAVRLLYETKQSKNRPFIDGAPYNPVKYPENTIKVGN